MGNKFLALRKSEVAKVTPDRAALMGKIDMKEIKEADERWLRILFGEPYEAKFQSGGDGNGDELLTYNAVLTIDNYYRAEANHDLYGT